jgi:hypothetical protein
MSKTQTEQQDRQQKPWNKGRLVGQKRPLKPKEVWNIRARLQVEARKRDLAMFNLAIDSKLRGCDFTSLKIDVRRRETARPRNDHPEKDGQGSPNRIDGTDSCVNRGLADHSQNPGRAVCLSEPRP